MIGLVSPANGLPLVRRNDELVSSAGDRFPIIDGIPRFVSTESYSDSFGLEWSIHSTTQLDSHTKTNTSRGRLERCIGAPVASLRGLDVLEAGCGAGRFTELLWEGEARVHAVDMSRAVEANAQNMSGRTDYSVVQADLHATPFPPGAFDVVLCLGVLQHLPSPEKGLASLWRLVKPGGVLVVDQYAWSLPIATKLAPLYRLILLRLSPERAKRIADGLTRLFFPMHWAIRRFFPLQALLSRFSPCLFYYRVFPELGRSQHYDLTRLDTFDHLRDRYKHLTTVARMRRMLTTLGATDLRVERGGNGVEARCSKPVGEVPSLG